LLQEFNINDKVIKKKEAIRRSDFIN